MTVLDAGGPVVILRFLPDGRRLLAGFTVPAESGRPDDATVRLVVLPVACGDPVTLDLPPLPLWAWWYLAHNGNVVAVHPDGDRVYIAWDGRLYCRRTADGKRVPLRDGIGGHQVVLSPDGRRLLVADLGREGKFLHALTTDDAGGSIYTLRPLPDDFRHLIGFLSDGERLATLDAAVRVAPYVAAEQKPALTYPARHASQPAVSPDGRHLGVIGYGKLYVYPVPPWETRRIGGTAAYGDFRAFAFHPDGKTLAVIHRGPTLVKLYDVETLKLRAKLNWKIGPLRSVAFSPDGALGAAGSADGRIVVWDVDS